MKDAPNVDVDNVLVKVIESRPVSNQIAEDLGVKHESPQVIYVKDKAKYWTASQLVDHDRAYDGSTELIIDWQRLIRSKMANYYIQGHLCQSKTLFSENL